MGIPGAFPPNVTTSPGSTSYIEAASGIAYAAIDPLLTVSDPDFSLSRIATVQITGGFKAGQDILSFTNTDSGLFGDISATYNSVYGTLTLS